MRSELPVRKASAKLLLVLQQISMAQFMRHVGISFEELHLRFDPNLGDQLYSLGVIGSVRAIACLVESPALQLISLQIQDDNA